jgi:pimeloyl-ACP methyl ester carboxylesterase
MVATGVADRVPDRLRHLVYLDAFVPGPGQSLDDLTGQPMPPTLVEGWLRPPLPSPADTAPEDMAWLTPRRRHQPTRCFSQKLALTGAGQGVPRTYIHCTRKEGHDVFRQFADRFRDDPAWRFRAMDASHSPNVTAPEALATLLLGLG